MNQIKAGALLNYINLFVRLGIGFILSPYILFKLGHSEFGLYSIAGTVVGWLALCDFGLTASTTKFLSEYRVKNDADGEAHYLGNNTALFCIIGVVVLILGLCLYPFLGGIFPEFTEKELSIYKVLYLMTLLNTTFMFPARSLSGIASSRQKFFVPGLIVLITSIFNVVGTVLLLEYGYKSIALIGWGIAVGIIGLGWNVYYCFKTLKTRISWNGWDTKLIKTMFAFSFWMFLDQLINIMNTGSGNFIVAMTRGPSEVSVYSYGLRLFQYFFMASSCVAGLFLPKVISMVSMGGSNEEQTGLMIKVARIQMLLIGCMYFGIIFFGREFFSLWIGKTLGERTNDCWFVTIVIMIPYGFLLLQALGWQLLQARNAMKARVRILLVVSFLSLILGYTLSFHFGIKALAIATSCSVILGQGLLMNWYYWKRLKLNMPRFFRETLYRSWLWLPLLAGGSVALNTFIPDMWWYSFFIKISLFMLLYAVVMFFIYANRSEKELLHVLKK